MGRANVELSEILETCVAKRVVRISFHANGQVSEVVFGPPKSELAKKKDDDPLASKREHYELLLGRPVSNVELANLPGGS